MEDVNAKLETLMQQLNSRIFPRKMECSYNPNDTMAMFNFFFIDFVEKNFENLRNSLKIQLLTTYSKLEISKENLINSIPEEFQEVKMDKIINSLLNDSISQSEDNLTEKNSERKCTSLSKDQSKELRKFMFDLHKIKLDIDKGLPMVEMKNFPRNNTNVEFTPQFPKVKGNREKENQSPYLTDKENPPKIKIDKQKEIPQMIERYRSPSPVLINKNRKLFIKNNAENTNTHNLSKGRSTPKSQYTFKTPYKLESAGKKATVQHWQY